MPSWHTRSRRKISGGLYRPFRKKRKYEAGRYPAETILGEKRLKKVKGRGLTLKLKLLRDKYANVTDPETKKTQKVKILSVIENPANQDYSRRGVITKGAIIKTELGKAIVTSRPGQDGVINAILKKE